VKRFGRGWEGSLRRPLDNNSELNGEEEARQQAQAAQEHRPHKHSARAIEDDRFDSITYEQACARLRQKEVGEFLLRPSGKGVEHLTLQIRFPSDAIANYSIVERGKQSENDVPLCVLLCIERTSHADLEENHWNCHTNRRQADRRGLMHRLACVVLGPIIFHLPVRSLESWASLNRWNDSFTRLHVADVSTNPAQCI